MKDKSIKKTFTFSTEEKNQLEDLEIGIAASTAQLRGMQFYKNIVLAGVYKRIGIDGKPREGFTNSVNYNLRDNKIEYTEIPIKKGLLVKK